MGKAIVVVAAEEGGRVRMAHVGDLTARTLGRVLDEQVAPDAGVRTDGLVSYNARALGGRRHTRVVQANRGSDTPDPVQRCHWVLALFKRWWLGTHHGAIHPKHLQAYLHEFEFRYNRRQTQGVGRLVARALQIAAISPPVTYRDIVHGPTLSPLASPCVP